MLNPLVSVLIPCYNVQDYVVEAVSSIMNQTYKNMEIILINDCSSDNTLTLLESLANQDARIKIYNNEENLKLIKTLNKGIELCSGKYIARMDADDIALPTRIAKEVDFLEEHEDYSIVSTRFYTFHSDTSRRKLHINPCSYEELKAFLLFKSGILHPGSMMRKTLFTELGFKFEAEYLHVEDYALWSKAAYVTKLANIEEPLMFYRAHKGQVSFQNEQLQTENKKKVFEIHCQKLGLPIDKDSMEVYSSVAESVPLYPDLGFLKKCEDLMLWLIEKNKKDHFCSQDYLVRMLSLHWLRLCANSRLGLKVLKKCFSSPLSDKRNYTKQDFFIFYIKCLFRMEYRKSVLYKIIFR